MAVRRRVRRTSAALFLGFTAVWALAWLLFGLGTCGDDAHPCEPGGRIFRNLTVIGAAAALVTAGLGTAAIRCRAVRPVLLLAGALTLAGAASLAADRL